MQQERITTERARGAGRAGSFAPDAIAADVRDALRSFRRNPGLTTTIVFTLALGLASTTTIFSVVNAVLLRPLPYAEPDRLVQIVESVPAEESLSGIAMRVTAMSADDFDWWRTNSDSLSHLAVIVPDNRTFARPEGAVRLPGALVSPALFAMRGVPPLLGRGLLSADERPGAAVVVIGESAWRRYFAAAPDVIGATMALDGRAYTIVGVMPAAFGREAYWLPAVVTPAQPGQLRLLPVVARLRDGVSIETANAEVNVSGHHLRGIEPDPGAPPRFAVVRELDQLTALVAPALRVLVAGGGAVVLIVCAHVANLLLVRGTGRHEEIAVRRACGATTGRIARHVLTESLLLASVAGGVGVAIASGAVTLLKTLAAVERPERFASAVGPGILPRLDEIAIDPAVLAFAVALSLASAMLFGSVPALRLARGSEAARRFGAQIPVVEGPTRVVHALATVQLALAVMLLIGAGLLLHSFFRLSAVDLGFDPHKSLSFELVVPGHYGPERKLQVAEALTARLRSDARISQIGFTDIAPLTPGISLGGGLLPVGSSEYDRREDLSLPMAQRTQQRYAGGDYLRALGARLRSGRWLHEEDRAQPGIPALVSRPYARRYFGNANPLGATIQSTFGVLTIVGVIDDLHLRGLDADPERIVFVDPRHALTAIRASSSPLWQTPEADRLFLTLGTGSVAFVVRTIDDPLAIVADLRTVARQVDPALAIDHAIRMEDVVSGSTMRPQFYAASLTVFGAVAALIAVVGIYGVLAYGVAQRTREFGIRMALGAQRRAVMRLVLRQGAAITALGVGAGVAGAVAMTRYLAGMLFGVTTLDAATYAAVSAACAAVALLASYLPARHATSIDPMVALRHD